jgi:hypothetical protein
MKNDKPIQFRLSSEDIARLDAIRCHFGLATYAAAVRFAVKALHNSGLFDVPAIVGRKIATTPKAKAPSNRRP